MWAVRNHLRVKARCPFADLTIGEKCFSFVQQSFELRAQEQVGLWQYGVCDMKVVLFCGGLGMRLREYSENVPKPMVPLGYRPLVGQVMKYYARFGHTDFILCLGYRGDLIKQYFLNYEECTSNDFVLSQGGRRRELLNSDILDWRITFVETGLNSNIGERLKAVEHHLAGEELFLANYSDTLTDMPLPEQIADLSRRDKVAS